VLDVLSVTRPVKAEEQVAFDKRDAKATDLIIQCTADTHVEFVPGESAKEIWNKLKTTFERKGTSSRLYLLKKLITMKFDDNESMETHLSQFDDLLRQVRLSGGKLDDDLIACMLLLTLPGSFNMVITAIETLSSDKITLEFVKSRLLDEEIKRNSRSACSTGKDNSSVKAAFGTSTNRFPFKCNFCHKPGHKKQDCWKWKRQQENTDKSANMTEENDFVAFMVSPQDHVVDNHLNMSWFLDSGASDHLFNDESYFSVSSELNSPITISVAKSGESLQAFKVGEINVS